MLRKSEEMDDYFIDLLDIGVSQDASNSHLISGNLGLSDITVDSIDNEGRFHYQLKVNDSSVHVCMYMCVFVCVCVCVCLCYGCVCGCLCMYVIGREGMQKINIPLYVIVLFTAYLETV